MYTTGTTTSALTRQPHATTTTTVTTTQQMMPTSHMTTERVISGPASMAMPMAMAPMAMPMAMPMASSVNVISRTMNPLANGPIVFSPPRFVNASGLPTASTRAVVTTGCASGVQKNMELRTLAPFQSVAQKNVHSREAGMEGAGVSGASGPVVTKNGLQLTTDTSRMPKDWVTYQLEDNKTDVKFRPRGFSVSSSGASRSVDWDIRARYMIAMRSGPTECPDHILAKSRLFPKKEFTSPYVLYYFDETAPNKMLLKNDVTNGNASNGGSGGGASSKNIFASCKGSSNKAVEDDAHLASGETSSTSSTSTSTSSKSSSSKTSSFTSSSTTSNRANIESRAINASMGTSALVGAPVGAPMGAPMVAQVGSRSGSTNQNRVPSTTGVAAVSSSSSVYTENVHSKTAGKPKSSLMACCSRKKGHSISSSAMYYDAAHASRGVTATSATSSSSSYTSSSTSSSSNVHQQKFMTLGFETYVPASTQGPVAAPMAYGVPPVYPYGNLRAPVMAPAMAPMAVMAPAVITPAAASRTVSSHHTSHHSSKVVPTKTAVATRSATTSSSSISSSDMMDAVTSTSSSIQPAQERVTATRKSRGCCRIGNRHDESRNVSMTSTSRSSSSSSSRSGTSSGTSSFTSTSSTSTSSSSARRRSMSHSVSKTGSHGSHGSHVVSHHTSRSAKSGSITTLSSVGVSRNPYVGLVGTDTETSMSGRAAYPLVTPSTLPERKRNLEYGTRKMFFDVDDMRVPRDGTGLKMLPQYSVSYRNYPVVAYDVVAPQKYNEFFRVRKAPGMFA